MKPSSYESARLAVPTVWSAILSITDRTPERGFKPSAARLIIVKIVPGESRITFANVPFESEQQKRIEQIRNALTDTATSITYPVGVVFVGKAHDGAHLDLDEVVLLQGAVDAVAQISNRSVEDVTEIIGSVGGSIASSMIRGKKTDGPLS